MESIREGLVCEYDQRVLQMGVEVPRQMAGIAFLQELVRPHRGHETGFVTMLAGQTRWSTSVGPEVKSGSEGAYEVLASS